MRRRAFAARDLPPRKLDKAARPLKLAGDARTIPSGQIMKKSAATPSTRPPPVPARWRGEIGRVLISERQIARRVREMSGEIERDFVGREMVVVSLLSGTVMFLADLMRGLALPMRVDFIGVSSYGAGVTPGELVFTKELRLDVRNRDVLLVDDILDTGRTLTKVLAKLRALKPRRIKICVLLDKAARRVEPVKAHYAGFEIPDYFVVGYGMDFGERYRNLPFIGILKDEVSGEQ
jgi:hypoxanthine phosphoribosyltransferase